MILLTFAPFPFALRGFTLLALEPLCFCTCGVARLASARVETPQAKASAKANVRNRIWLCYPPNWVNDKYIFRKQQAVRMTQKTAHNCHKRLVQELA